MKICSYCQGHRSRLYACVVCGARLCGCCSYRLTTGPRVCCANDPGLICQKEQMRREGRVTIVKIPAS